MKILIVSNLYPPNVVGGYERLAHTVASALVDRGHEIHVLTSTYGGKHEEFPGQSITRELRLLADDRNIYAPLDMSDEERAALNVDNVETFRALAARVQPDVVFVWNLYFFDHSLIAGIQDCGVPTALFLTDNWLAAAQEPERVGAFFQRFVHGEERFSGGADLTNGGETRRLQAAALFGSNFIRNFYGACGYLFSRDWVVHNGVRMPADVIAPARDRRRLYQDGTLRLLFAGRLVDIKGPDHCVSAMGHLRSLLGEDIAIELTIVGDGQDTDFLERMAELIRNDTSGAHITILPPVAEEDLAQLWNSHDVYLFPSLYEPFSLTLILALAAGIPTVASDIGGNDEIVFDDATGFMFRSRDPHDMARQIARLAQDGALRQRLSTRSRQLARKFTFQRMIDQIDGILGSLGRNHG